MEPTCPKRSKTDALLDLTQSMAPVIILQSHGLGSQGLRYITFRELDSLISNRECSVVPSRSLRQPRHTQQA